LQFLCHGCLSSSDTVCPTELLRQQMRL
jgi:hypothetical protein